jgi:hypothetical protein
LRNSCASALESSAERSAAEFCRSLHDDEACAVEVLDKPPGDDLGHDLVGVMDATQGLVFDRAGDADGSELRQGVSTDSRCRSTPLFSTMLAQRPPPAILAVAAT